MSATTSPLVELTKNPAQLERVARGVTAIVTNSFVDRPCMATTAEIKRRGNICIELFKELRRDCGFSVERCLDVIPGALRAKIDGSMWEPPTGNTWAGSDEGPTVWTPDRARSGLDLLPLGRPLNRRR